MTEASREDIIDRLAELECDERLVRREPADVAINAPLALLQADMAAEANALRWVLGLPRQRYPLPDVKEAA